MDGERKKLANLRPRLACARGASRPLSRRGRRDDVAMVANPPLSHEQIRINSLLGLLSIVALVGGAGLFWPTERKAAPVPPVAVTKAAPAVRPTAERKNIQIAGRRNQEGGRPGRRKRGLAELLKGLSDAQIEGAMESILQAKGSTKEKDAIQAVFDGRSATWRWRGRCRSGQHLLAGPLGQQLREDAGLLWADRDFVGRSLSLLG